MKQDLFLLSDPYFELQGKVFKWPSQDEWEILVRLDEYVGNGLFKFSTSKRINKWRWKKGYMIYRQDDLFEVKWYEQFKNIPLPEDYLQLISIKLEKNGD